MVINVLYKKHIEIISENVMEMWIWGGGLDFTSFSPSFERMGPGNYLDKVSIMKQMSFQI